MEKKIFKEEDMLTAKQIRKELGNKVSLRQIYRLLECGEIAPAFRYGGRKGLCAPRAAVQTYKNRCLVEVGA